MRPCFPHLAPELRGIPRDGAYNTLNTTGFNPIRFDPQAPDVDRFQSSFGAVWRRIMDLGPRRGRGPGISAWSSLPGGASGDPESPLYASRLARWLTGDYDEVIVRTRDLHLEARRIEHFVPMPVPGE